MNWLLMRSLSFFRSSSLKSLIWKFILKIWSIEINTQMVFFLYTGRKNSLHLYSNIQILYIHLNISYNEILYVQYSWIYSWIVNLKALQNIADTLMYGQCPMSWAQFLPKSEHSFLPISSIMTQPLWTPGLPELRRQKMKKTTANHIEVTSS